MADTGSGEKTEEPTDKRLKDARKKGQVWRSRDLTGVAVFLAALLALDGALRFGWGELQTLVRHALGELSRDGGEAGDAIARTLWLGLRAVVVLSLPVAATAAGMGALVDFLQVRGVFSAQPLTPKLDKLNPVTGFKNLVGKKALLELLKNAVKVAAAAVIVVATLRSALHPLVQTARGGPAEALAVLRELLSTIALWVAVFFAFAAAFDVWLQRRSFRKDLRMTKDEVRREHKEMEGDAHVRARRRQLRFELLLQAQTRAVARADVLVTNPTHVAVALAYDAAVDGAPRIVAKGVDGDAERLKRAAAEAGVLEVRDVPLARALLQLAVDEEIPERLYDAVAEVMTLVYRTRAEAAARAATVSTPPEARP